jgi:hypothetical protein
VDQPGRAGAELARGALEHLLDPRAAKKLELGEADSR